MKNSIISIILLISYFSINAQEGSKNFIDQNFIEVTGTSEMELIPDEIQITISVKDKDFKTKQAFADFEKRVVTKLQEIGVSIDNEFSIMNMNSSLKVSLIGKDNMFSTRQYMVVVHDALKANEVFDEMEAIGVTTMAVTKFNHSEIEKYRLQVKVNAIKAAKDKAKALAMSIDQTIGRALFINEVNFNSYQPKVYANVMYKDKLESSYTEIDKVNFQKIKLSFSVLVRFDLK